MQGLVEPWRRLYPIPSYPLLSKNIFFYNGSAIPTTKSEFFIN